MKSNREAAAAGELGGNVLEVAAAERKETSATVDPATGLGHDEASRSMALGDVSRIPEASFGGIQLPFHTIKIDPDQRGIRLKGEATSDMSDRVASLLDLFKQGEPHDLIIPSVGTRHGHLVEVSTGASITRRDGVNVEVYFREDIADGSAQIPTMRAECAASDVTEGEQDRAGAPPPADCGPSFILGPSKAVSAMIADGWKILDEPAS